MVFESYFYWVCWHGFILFSFTSMHLYRWWGRRSLGRLFLLFFKFIFNGMGLLHGGDMTCQLLRIWRATETRLFQLQSHATLCLRWWFDGLCLRCSVYTARRLSVWRSDCTAPFLNGLHRRQLASGYNYLSAAVFVMGRHSRIASPRAIDSTFQRIRATSLYMRFRIR